MAAVAFFVAPGPLHYAVHARSARACAWARACCGLRPLFRYSTESRRSVPERCAGLGETRVPMLANLVGYWVLGLPLGMILCFVLKWGIYGMWIGLTLALVVISMTLLFRWHKDSARWAVHIDKV